MYDVNYLAVIVATVAAMIIGTVWYMPALFGTTWAKELGKKVGETGSNPGPAMFGMVLASLVMVYILAHFILATEATSWVAGAITGLWTWFGFVATMSVSQVLFEGRSWKLFFINMGNQLLTFVVAGAILGGWR